MEIIQECQDYEFRTEEDEVLSQTSLQAQEDNSALDLDTPYQETAGHPPHQQQRCIPDQ